MLGLPPIESIGLLETWIFTSLWRVIQSNGANPMTARTWTLTNLNKSK